MKIVRLTHGALELRWTWLPYWLVAGPKWQREIEAVMRDAVILNGLPPAESSLDRIEAFVLRRIAEAFPIPGITEYLKGLRHLPD